MRIILLLLAVGVLISCSSNDSELQQLQRENETLKTQLNEVDSLLSDINATYGDIATNLGLIEVKKQHINDLATQGKLTEEDKNLILEEMESIQDLLGAN